VCFCYTWEIRKNAVSFHGKNVGYLGNKKVRCKLENIDNCVDFDISSMAILLTIMLFTPNLVSQSIQLMAGSLPTLIYCPMVAR
jgi:hypothetical protein